MARIIADKKVQKSLRINSREQDRNIRKNLAPCCLSMLVGSTMASPFKQKRSYDSIRTFVCKLSVSRLNRASSRAGLKEPGPLDSPTAASPARP